MPTATLHYADGRTGTASFSPNDNHVTVMDLQQSVDAEKGQIKLRMVELIFERVHASTHTYREITAPPVFREVANQVPA